MEVPILLERAVSSKHRRRRHSGRPVARPRIAQEVSVVVVTVVEKPRREKQMEGMMLEKQA